MSDTMRVAIVRHFGAALTIKQMALLRLAEDLWARWLDYALESMRTADATVRREPFQSDHRFAAAPWRAWPFGPMHQAFLAVERWWDAAKLGVRGVSPHHEDVVAFAAGYCVATSTPLRSNRTNGSKVRPQRTARGGRNGWRGSTNARASTVRRRRLPAKTVFRWAMPRGATCSSVEPRRVNEDLCRFQTRVVAARRFDVGSALPAPLETVSIVCVRAALAYFRRIIRRSA